MSKKINPNLYMESKICWKEFAAEYDTQGYLFSGGRYRTKILPEDLPEWFVYGYIYKRHGFISAKGLRHLLYVPNYTFKNHLHKYDTLFISYNAIIEPCRGEDNFSWYKGYDHAIGGPLIVEFVEAAGKYSNYDVRDIQQEIAKKRAWYEEQTSAVF